MGEKVIARFYVTYGKMDGEEHRDDIVGIDSEEFRKELLDEIYFDDAYDSEDEFINGDINSFTYGSYYGDWDDPTGGFIVIYTKQELIREIEKKASEELAAIERMFEGGR